MKTVVATAFIAICILFSSIAEAARYPGLSKDQKTLVQKRISQGAPGAKLLIRRLGDRLAIRASASELGGGYYTETLISGARVRFVVHLAPQSLSSLGRDSNEISWDTHMLWHELGHVITNAYFTQKLYSSAFSIFSSSELWQECFPDATNQEPGSCVPPDEILADQLAFWATGNREARSPRNVPPLFVLQELKSTIIKPLLLRSLH